MASFSVLMSIYIKEKPEYVKTCFDSLLQQTELADEWVIVEDGPLTEDMYKLLDLYQKDYPGLIKRIPLKQNQGLGKALAIGIPECKNEIIARMDTDDIARKDRFEKQLKKFEGDSKIDICGSIIYEFENDISNIVAKRTVPTNHNDIIKYQKRRDAFNHMTVMYRKSIVLQAGNYLDCPLMEDTYLWVRMIMIGAKCCNINEPLVYTRIGRDMYERRGGWGYFLKYRAGRKMVYSTGYISKVDYFITIAIQLIVSLVPNRVRGWIFKSLLHG